MFDAAAEGARAGASSGTSHERAPSAELGRLLTARDIHHSATRLDALYQAQMASVGRARAEEAALLKQLVQAVRPALVALVEPLLLLDVRAPKRPVLLPLRALRVFGEGPARGSRSEGLFLLEDARFLRLRFTGATEAVHPGRVAWGAELVEPLDSRRVLREHHVEDVARALAEALCAQTTRRRRQVRDTEAHLERLRAVRTLLRG
jgi:hypothetical protein